MKRSILRRFLASPAIGTESKIELRRNAPTQPWGLSSLEPRMMLAGDAGAEVAAAVTDARAVTVTVFRPFTWYHTVIPAD
jgi:hypothetical protein